MTLGELLQQRRGALGLAVREVSRRSGINSGYLSQLERDNVEPRVSSLVKIAEAYETSPPVLLLAMGVLGSGDDVDWQAGYEAGFYHGLAAARQALDALIP